MHKNTPKSQGLTMSNNSGEVEVHWWRNRDRTNPQMVVRMLLDELAMGEEEQERCWCKTKKIAF